MHSTVVQMSDYVQRHQLAPLFLTEELAEPHLASGLRLRPVLDFDAVRIMGLITDICSEYSGRIGRVRRHMPELLAPARSYREREGQLWLLDSAEGIVGHGRDEARHDRRSDGSGAPLRATVCTANKASARSFAAWSSRKRCVGDAPRSRYGATWSCWRQIASTSVSAMCATVRARMSVAERRRRAASIARDSIPRGRATLLGWRASYARPSSESALDGQPRPVSRRQVAIDHRVAVEAASFGFVHDAAKLGGAAGPEFALADDLARREQRRRRRASLPPRSPRGRARSSPCRRRRHCASVQAWMMAAWPTVTSSPIDAWREAPSTWMIVPSWMLVRAPMRMRLVSPRMTQSNQTPHLRADLHVADHRRGGRDEGVGMRRGG